VTPPPEEPPEQPPDDPEAQLKWCEAWIEWLEYNGWWKYREAPNFVKLAAMREWRESIELQLVSYDWDYFQQEGGDILILGILPTGMAVASWGGASDELAAPYIDAPANVLGDPDRPGYGYRRPYVASNVHSSGKPHGSPAHWAAMRNKVTQMAASGQYSDIYVNKVIKTSTTGLIVDGRRPDIVGLRAAGGYHIVEVVSPSQTVPQLEAKCVSMQAAFRSLYVTYEVIVP
jgi:hypothetical protein